jgi:ATP-dependent DNA helicase 2 subunit 2
MAAPTKENVVILLDVGLGMTKGKKSTELLEGAIKAVTLLVQQKILYSSKDELGLVLFGTNKTQNELAEGGREGYENINVMYNILPPNLQLLRDIESITPGDAEADFIAALIVGMDMLIKKAGQKNVQKRIFLVTNAGSQVFKEDMPIVVDKLKEMDARLNVIGVDFADEHSATNLNQSNKIKAKEKVKQENEELLRELCGQVKGVVVPVTQAIEMMSYFRSKSVLQRTSFRGFFEVSQFVKIPVWAFKKTAEMKLPTLAKVSKVSQESENPGTMGVIPQGTFHNVMDENPDEEVPEAQRVKGYKYGKTLVPFSKIDEDALKLQTESELKLIGFSAKTNVPRHHYQADVECIVSLPGDSDAATALSALIHALAETNSVAIVRFVKRKNAPPQLGVLTPSIKTDHEVLYYNKLPFSEDIRQYAFAPLLSNTTRKSYVPSEEQLNAAEELINSLDLTKAASDEDGNPIEALKPKYTYNPALQHFYQVLQSRAMQPEAPLPPLDALVEKYVNPDEELFKNAEDSLKNFKEKFVFVKTELKEKENRRRNWSEAFLRDEDVTLESYMAGGEKKKQKLDDGQGMSLQSIISGGVNEVGTITPVQDFKNMLTRKDVDLVDTAIKQMRDRIVKFVHESIKDSYYDKAIECLDALRSGCLQEGEVGNFNNFMNDLKKFFRGKRRNDFWERIVSKDISLITMDENAESDITGEDAVRFLKGDMVIDSSAQNNNNNNNNKEEKQVGDEHDAESLFDMLE